MSKKTKSRKYNVMVSLREHEAVAVKHMIIAGDGVKDVTKTAKKMIQPWEHIWWIERYDERRENRRSAKSNIANNNDAT